VRCFAQKYTSRREIAHLYKYWLFNLLLEFFIAASFLAPYLATSVLKVSNFCVACCETVAIDIAVRKIFAAFTACRPHEPQHLWVQAKARSGADLAKTFQIVTFLTKNGSYFPIFVKNLSSFVSLA
jgi:hypothetical protein